MTTWLPENDEVEALAARWSRQEELDAAGLRALESDTAELCDRLEAGEDVEGLIALMDVGLSHTVTKRAAKALAGFGAVVVPPLVLVENSSLCTPDLYRGVQSVFKLMDRDEFRRGLEDVLARFDDPRVHGDVEVRLRGLPPKKTGDRVQDALDYLEWADDEVPPWPREGSLVRLMGRADRRPERTRPMDPRVEPLLERWFAAADAEDDLALKRFAAETDKIVDHLEREGDHAALIGLLDLPYAAEAKPLLDRIDRILVAVGRPIVNALLTYELESGGSSGGARAFAIARRIDPALRSITLEDYLAIGSLAEEAADDVPE